MTAAIRARTWGSWLVILVLITTVGCAAPRAAQAPPAPAPAAPAPPGPVPAAPTVGAPAPPAHDLLNAVLWMQRSVEYKATAMGAFALARLRLDPDKRKAKREALEPWTGP